MCVLPHEVLGDVTVKKVFNVVGAIIFNQDKIFCVQRGPGRALENYWEFPGGKIEEDESHQEAVIREIQEELLCDINPLQKLITITHQYPEFHMTMHLYISELIKGEPTLTEHSAMQWVGPEDLDDVNWIPADIDIIASLKSYLVNLVS